MLSGLSEDVRAVHTRMWNEKTQPEISKRLNALTAARNLLEQRSHLLLTEIPKAIGAGWDKVSALRSASSDFERALISDRFVTNPLA